MTDRFAARHPGVAPALISGLGVAMAAVELEHVSQMDTTIGMTLEAGVPLALACLLVVAGGWLARSGFDPEGTFRILSWVVVGTIGMLLVTVWVIGHQLIRGETFHHTTFVLTNTAIVGSVTGFVIGVYDAQSKRRRAALVEERRKLTRERERMSFLNHLLRHNVLNGMNVVLGRADSLRNEVSDEGRGHLDAIHRCSEDVVDLIRDVSTLTHVASEQRDAQFGPVDLASILDRQVEGLRVAFDDVVVETDVPAGVSVCGDDLLSEVFENVLYNAVQHNEGVAHVTVDADLAPDGETVTVSIADDGPGIPPEQRDRLFRVTEADVGRDGHGIGLVIARVLVTRYGGDIRVRDNEPSGTVFDIELPTACAATVDTPDPVVQRPTSTR
ncbi:sensor histidine kinase [Halomarina litorea]|uniref:sensor histidine kinase n=1 Tax=Halomarina litorea TaxID=2961595 RepID=UPI0020C320B1|nr:HAMP domain-containing sensor histidine kinase [Halomarina sp. BCD28]